ASSPDPAADGGPRRPGLAAHTSRLVLQQDGKEDGDLSEAESHGMALDCQALAAWLVELNELGPLCQLLTQAGVLLVCLGELLQKFGSARPRELGVLDGLLDFGSMVVDGLAGAAGLLGRRGDVAVRAGEDSSGVADPAAQG